MAKFCMGTFCSTVLRGQCTLGLKSNEFYVDFKLTIKLWRSTDQDKDTKPFLKLWCSQDHSGLNEYEVEDV